MGQIPHDILKRLGYFQGEVEALFRRLFEDQLGAAALAEKSPFPPVDVVEGPDEVWVRVDLPGTPRDGIELFGAPNFLVIRGRKPSPSEKLRYLRVERVFGAFQRLVVLPSPCNPARIQARYDRGVLEVRVPKVTDRRAVHRKIPIE